MKSPLRHLPLPLGPARLLAAARRHGVAVPQDAPRAHAPGIDPDRILVFGNGAAVGWGVDSHAQALPGQIARKVAAHTGRGVDVDAVASPSITIVSAAEALPVDRLGQYDAVVVIVGVSDALRLRSTKAWRAGMTELLDRVERFANENAEVLVVGVHRPSSLSILALQEGAAADKRADQFDEITNALCAERVRFHFVLAPELPETLPDSGTERAVQGFGLWATAHANMLAPLLDERVNQGLAARRSRDVPQSDEVRLAALRAMGILDTPPEKRFDDITERARILLGTAGAAFSIIDRDRLWNKSYSGAGVTEVPLRGAMCAVTIQSGVPFVVPDVWHDDRFVTHPSVRFYAGHPVETPDGVRIGALCVTDPSPRTADSVDLVLLRELALSVQRELALTPVFPAAAADTTQPVAELEAPELAATA